MDSRHFGEIKTEFSFTGIKGYKKQKTAALTEPKHPTN
jgi:hypothetical protein